MNIKDFYSIPKILSLLPINNRVMNDATADTCGGEERDYIRTCNEKKFLYLSCMISSF